MLRQRARRPIILRRQAHAGAFSACKQAQRVQCASQQQHMRRFPHQVQRARHRVNVQAAAHQLRHNIKGLRRGVSKAEIARVQANGAVQALRNLVRNRRAQLLQRTVNHASRRSRVAVHGVFHGVERIGGMMVDLQPHRRAKIERRAIAQPSLVRRVNGQRRVVLRPLQRLRGYKRVRARQQAQPRRNRIGAGQQRPLSHRAQRMPHRQRRADCIAIRADMRAKQDAVRILQRGQHARTDIRIIRLHHDVPLAPPLPSAPVRYARRRRCCGRVQRSARAYNADPRAPPAPVE